MKRPAIVAANWKMNGNLALVKTIAEAMNNIQLAENVEVILCPSFPYLAAMSAELGNENVHLGAQNINENLNGAFTGEVSGQMLQEFAVHYVIVGHSERRTLFKESSNHVAEKVKAALDCGLRPILCIGESESERTAGHTDIILASQLQPVIDTIGIERFEKLVLAYEPVWAIGTGKTASPAMAQQTHGFIREFLAKHDEHIAANIPLLYGGSVNAANCSELFAQPDIDGGLIGGASLKVDEFETICLTAKGL